MKYLMIVALCACAGCNSPTGPSPEESRLRVENMRLQAERDALLIGRIIEHTIGYRAEFAYPSELFCEDAELAATVSKLYGVPCAVEKLPAPVKPKTDDLYNSPWYSTTLNPTAAKKPAPVAPSPLVTPTFAQVKALGASKWQKQQLQVSSLAQTPSVDWREVLKSAFFKSFAPAQADDAVAGDSLIISGC